MKITAKVFDSGHDFSIKLNKYNPNMESEFEITIDEFVINVTEVEWQSFKQLTQNAMDFLKEND